MGTIINDFAPLQNSRRPWHTIITTFIDGIWSAFRTDRHHQVTSRQAGASRFARLEAAVRQRSEHVRLVERVAVSLYSSLFSFRRPQCRSFDESYSGIGFAPWSASIIPT